MDSTVSNDKVCQTCFGEGYIIYKHSDGRQPDIDRCPACNKNTSGILTRDNFDKMVAWAKERENANMTNEDLFDTANLARIRTEAAEFGKMFTHHITLPVSIAEIAERHAIAIILLENQMKADKMRLCDEIDRLTTKLIKSQDALIELREYIVQ